MLGQLSEASSCLALLELIQDDSRQVQDAALRSLMILGKYPENQVAEQAVRLLGDSRNNVRSRVGALLTSLGALAVKPLLAELESPIPLVRRQATEILGVLGDPSAADDLIRALRDSDQEVVASAAQALGRLKIKDSVDPILAAYRLYPDMGHLFAEALGNISDGRAVPYLLFRLNTTSGLEAFAIAEALGEIARPQAIDTLLTRMSDAHGMMLEVLWKSVLNIARQNQMDVLSLMNSPQITKRMKEIVKDHADRELFPDLSRSLTGTSTSHGVLLMASRFHCFPSEIRRVLARELGQINGKVAVKVLKQALEDEDILVVRQAAESLAQIGTPVAVAALKQLLASDNEVKVLAGIRALKPMNIDPFSNELDKLRTSRNPSIQRAVESI